jgi:hypothetical protein
LTAAIEQRIAVNSEAVSVQTDLASLRKLLSDALAAGFVPSYDQRRLGDVRLLYIFAQTRSWI